MQSYCICKMLLCSGTYIERENLFKLFNVLFDIMFVYFSNSKLNHYNTSVILIKISYVCTDILSHTGITKINYHKIIIMCVDIFSTPRKFRVILKNMSKCVEDESIIPQKRNLILRIKIIQYN